MPKMLSKNFSLDEFIFSQTASRKNIDNTPDAATLINLKRLADTLEPGYGTVLATAKAVAKSGIAFDQVIFEYGKWVHLGLAKNAEQARSELLSIGSNRIYVPGLRMT